MPGKEGAPDTINGPHQDRREAGVARPERAGAARSTDETPDNEGIEIDNAIERPQEGQPGQPGGKLN